MPESLILNEKSNKLDVDKISDEELVSFTLQNQDFFLHIMNRYEKKLFYYIMRITNLDPEDAQDVLQDVFIKVYKNLNDFDSNLKFSSWIYRITRNQVISNFRKIKARPENIPIDFREDVLNNLISEIDTVKDMDHEIMKKNISQILSGMDEKYRGVLVLKFLEEKDYKEISDIIKKPLGTVGTLINRAKKQFKKELEKSQISI